MTGSEFLKEQTKKQNEHGEKIAVLESITP